MFILFLLASDVPPSNRPMEKLALIPPLHLVYCGCVWPTDASASNKLIAVPLQLRYQNRPARSTGSADTPSSYRYIKELADRLNTLENSISTGGDLHSYGLAGESEHSPGLSDSTSPPPAAAMAGGVLQPRPRKRTLSSSSELQQGVHLQPLSQATSAGSRQERLPSIDSFHPATQHQHQQRSQLLQHESQRQLPQPLHPRASQGSDVGRLQPQQYPSTSISTDGTRQNYWKGPFQDRTASLSFPYDMDSQRPSASSPLTPEVKTFEWDEDSIDQ